MVGYFLQHFLLHIHLCDAGRVYKQICNSMINFSSDNFFDDVILALQNYLEKEKFTGFRGFGFLPQLVNERFFWWVM